MKRVVWLCAFLLLLPVLAGAQKPKAQTPSIPGFSAERLARIAPAMEQLIREGKFPGISVTVARKGKVAYQQEFGFADVEKKLPLKKDAIYRIFSMSKPITGVAVMILFEEGRFLLDDPVSKYVPCWKNLQVFDAETPEGLKLVKANREVTIRDLLRQTSGFSYGGSADAVGKLYQSTNLMAPDSTLPQMMEKACSIPLLFQPGSKWEYGVSIDMLGALVEVISGQPLDEFMQKRIFGPLKMVDTGFFVPEEKLGRFVTSYAFVTGKGLVAAPPERGVDRYRQGRVTLLSGGGGLVSTASDYLRFATMLARGGELDGVRILGPKTVALMSMNQLPKGVEPAWWGGKNGGNGYGFTMSVTTDVAATTGYGSVGDFGWDGAASTFFRVDPKEDLVVLVMTHRTPCDLEIQVKAKALVYQALVRD
jgi:CubicO group peptidase (beta-lactamase class C family)